MIRVLGVGNMLMKDEGIGIHVVRKLKETDMPPCVEVLDAGVAGIGIIHLMEGADSVIFVDAADMGKLPGEIAFFSPCDVKEDRKDCPELSLHDTGLLGILELASLLVRPPEVFILGVQPADISYGIGLSGKLSDRLPDIVEFLNDKIRELSKLGIN